MQSPYIHCNEVEEHGEVKINLLGRVELSLCLLLCPFGLFLSPLHAFLHHYKSHKDTCAQCGVYRWSKEAIHTEKHKYSKAIAQP